MSGPRQADFDGVARVYRWAEYAALGLLLERTREEFLPDLAGQRMALVLGDGDGRFLARLLARDEALRAVAVDTSAAMLRLLTERCGFAAERLEVKQGSALTVDAPPETDLVVTHFVLDCFTQAEVKALVERVGAVVRSGTLWVVSDFGVPKRPLLGPLAAVYVRGLYLAFRVLTGLRVTRLPDAQMELAAAGFERLARRERIGGVIYTELWRRR